MLDWPSDVGRPAVVNIASLLELLRRERAPFFRVWIRRRLALGGGDGFFDLARGFLLPGGDGGGIRPALLQQVLLGDLQAIAAARRGPGFRLNVIRNVMLAMTAKAEQRSDHHLWSA